MKVDAKTAFEIETRFLTGVASNFEAAKGRHFVGSIWQTTRHDDEPRLRAMLAERGVIDRGRFESMPANRRVALHGFVRRFLFGKRPTGVAVATVLSPLSRLVADGEASAPVTLAEVMSHVSSVMKSGDVPHVIGVCSPTGFSDDVKNARIDLPRATVILIEPERLGGWRVSACGGGGDPRMLEVFDPEGPGQKVERIRRLIDERSADLLTGGLSVSQLASESHLPEEMVRRGVEQAAQRDPELRIARQDGEWLVFRGAPAASSERKPMNVIDRIRQLFARDGGEPEKINVLAERRAALARRRDRIYEDIAKLESKEAELFEQGKNATSAVPRRRIAAQLAQLRKDIARQNTTAAMLNQQINIISTDIHNLTLIQQGQIAQLPETEELTEHAVQAEELLESLRADADLVSGLETGIEASLVSAEEKSILEEFERAASPATPASESARPAPQAREAAKRAEPQRAPTRRLADAAETPPPLPGESDRARKAEPS